MKLSHKIGISMICAGVILLAIASTPQAVGYGLALIVVGCGVGYVEL